MTHFSCFCVDERGGGGGGQGGGGGNEEGRPRWITARGKLVGGDLAYHSAQGMRVLLGEQPQNNAPADQLTVMLARKTRSELYEYLAQMQGLLHQNPHQARNLLIENPQLARALFHMEIVLGMVNNPLGDIAPKGVAPPGLLPPRPHDGGGGGGAPDYGHYGGGAVPMMPGGAAPPMAMDPRQQVPAPPQPMAPAPRPMVSMAGGGPGAGTLPAPPAPAPAPALPGAVPGMSADQQQALLQQVMNLTPAQIEVLSPEQKAQVLALQQQLVSYYYYYYFLVCCPGVIFTMKYVFYSCSVAKEGNSKVSEYIQ